MAKRPQITLVDTHQSLTEQGLAIDNKRMKIEISFRDLKSLLHLLYSIVTIR